MGVEMGIIVIDNNRQIGDAFLVGQAKDEICLQI
jgi:hypothetical protein